MNKKVTETTDIESFTDNGHRPFIENCIDHVQGAFSGRSKIAARSIIQKTASDAPSQADLPFCVKRWFGNRVSD
jgi:hypothetical protein